MGDVDSAWWRGKADATLEDHDRRLSAINSNLQELTHAVADLRASASRFATLFALAVAVASLFGSAVGALVVYQFTKS